MYCEHGSAVVASDGTRRPPPIPGRVWAIAAVTGAGAFMAMLDSTVANLAVESIREDLGTTLPVVQWVVTGYLVALAVSLPAQGWLGRRHGFGRVWTGSLLVFVLTSAACAVAPSPGWLIAARLLQGLAAGLLVPAGQAIIGAAATPRQLGRLMGVLGTVVALGPALGPAFGGLLLDTASWRWLFAINVPVGLGALVAARTLVPPGDRDPNQRLDVRGLALLATGLPLALHGATRVGAEGPAGWRLLEITVGVALVAGFVVASRRTARPLIDLALPRRPGFTPATVTAALTGANMYGGLLLLPLYLQLDVGLDATATGLLLLAMGLGSALALYLAGTLTDRHGPRPVTLAGGLLLAVTTVPLLSSDPPGRTILAVLLAARGAGLALAQMPAMTAAYNAVTSRQMGDAATLVNIAQRLGGALGAAGLVSVIATRAPAGRGGYATALAALLLLGVVTLLPAAALRRQGAGE